MQKKVRNEKKRLALESWRILSDEWESGNLTQPAFCESKNIKLKTFLKWRQKVLQVKEMAEKIVEKTPEDFLPAQVISQSTQPQARSTSMVPSVIVKLPNGISLQVASNTDKAFLKAVFELLGVTSC